MPRSSNRLGDLPAELPHDFNNMLTAIGGNISLALHELTSSDPLRELLIEAEEAASSAAGLTRQLLDIFSQADHRSSGTQPKRNGAATPEDAAAAAR